MDLSAPLFSCFRRWGRIRLTESRHHAITSQIPACLRLHCEQNTSKGLSVTFLECTSSRTPRGSHRQQDLVTDLAGALPLRFISKPVTPPRRRVPGSRFALPNLALGATSILQLRTDDGGFIEDTGPYLISKIQKRNRA